MYGIINVKGSIQLDMTTMNFSMPMTFSIVCDRIELI